MFSKIGALIISLGIMSADSVDILIPFMMVMLGVVFVAIGERGESK